MTTYDPYGGRSSGGFIKILATLVLAIFVLQYAFHLDIFGFLSNSKAGPYFEKVFNWAQGIWNAYLWPYASIAWKYILIGWAFVIQNWAIIWAKIAAVGSKFFHTVPATTN